MKIVPHEPEILNISVNQRKRNIFHTSNTYKNPVKNRSTTKVSKLGLKLDIKVHANEASKVGAMMARRPFVSTKKPHIWELNIMPVI